MFWSTSHPHHWRETVFDGLPICVVRINIKKYILFYISFKQQMTHISYKLFTDRGVLQGLLSWWSFLLLQMCVAFSSTLNRINFKQWATPAYRDWWLWTMVLRLFHSINHLSVWYTANNNWFTRIYKVYEPQIRNNESTWSSVVVLHCAGTNGGYR